jgi:hypothetical protein
MKQLPNKPAAPNAGTVLQFHSEGHSPGVGEPGRSAEYSTTI